MDALNQGNITGIFAPSQNNFFEEYNNSYESYITFS